MFILHLVTLGRLLAQQPADLDCAPRIAPTGELVVALKPLARWLGASVEWSSADRSASIARDGRTLRLWIGNATAQERNVAILLTPPARIDGGRILVPLRPIAQALGAKVALTPAGDAVLVTDGSRQARIPLPGKSPAPITSQPMSAYQAGYPPDQRRRAAWVTLQQFLYAFRDGRTADAEARCTPTFAQDYSSRLFRPLRPLRVEGFELLGWADASHGRVWIRATLQVREVTTWGARKWSFRLTPEKDGWLIDAASMK